MSPFFVAVDPVIKYSSMKLSEYINWLESEEFDYYSDTMKFADHTQPGHTFVRNVTVPTLDFIKKITTLPRSNGKNLENVYTYGRHPVLDSWADKTFPEFRYKQTLVQLQKPGDKVAPHVDTLHGQIKEWMEKDPTLGDIEHSMQNPNPNFKARRYFIGVEDHVEGQSFKINNDAWEWKKGDTISLNVWRAVHNTVNNSNKDRYIIKVTGLEK